MEEQGQRGESEQGRSEEDQRSPALDEPVVGNDLRVGTEIEKSAKQDMMVGLASTLVGDLKLRWAITNPGVDIIL